MVVATHLIKVKGTFDDNKWTDEKLKNFVSDKIKNEIENIYHPDLELFNTNNGTIDVWVYVGTLLSDVSEKVIGDWIKNHIKEEGLTVENFEIKKYGNGFFVTIS